MNDSAEVCEEICEEIANNRDVNWHQLDKKKFFFFGTALFFLVRAAVYPAALVKTRMQIERRGSQYTGTLATFAKVWGKDGFRGFYHGFATTAMGIVPAQGLYLATYEKVRADAKDFMPSPNQEMVRNLIAGGSASLASQLVICPVDVISQRLIVQAMEAKEGVPTKFNSGIDVARHIIKRDGPKGLYRGFWSSLSMYAPSSGIWWATYGFVQDKLNNRVLTCEEDRQTYRVPVQAFCGMSAGMTAATLTNPLDVIKTRIQTSSKKLTVATAVRQLISTEGVMGFSNGMTAKVMNSAPVSVLMISVYDLVKRLSVKAVPHFHVEGEPHKIVMLTKKEDGWTAGDGRKIKEKEDKK